MKLFILCILLSRTWIIYDIGLSMSVFKNMRNACLGYVRETTDRSDVVIRVLTCNTWISPLISLLSIAYVVMISGKALRKVLSLSKVRRCRNRRQLLSCVALLFLKHYFLTPFGRFIAVGCHSMIKFEIQLKLFNWSRHIHVLIFMDIYV